MAQLRAYRFQLRAKPAQERQLTRWMGGLRWIWNRAIHTQNERCARGEKYAGFTEMCKWLTLWRNDPATPWLAEGPSAAQQQILKRLNDAYQRFSPRRQATRSSRGEARIPGCDSPGQLNLPWIKRTIGSGPESLAGFVRDSASRSSALRKI